MRYNRLGSSGLRVSQIGLGMMSYGDTTRRAWQLGVDDALPIVRAAVESGVNLFDTADMYDRGASEVVTVQLLSRLFSNRADYVLATKVYFPMSDGPNGQGLSRKHITDSIDTSLRRLGVDHLDLYQIHRWDEQTPIEETMQALHELVRAGKVRYLGASSMYAWQLSKAQYTARIAGSTPFTSMQNHYNLLYREEEREMLPLCRDRGVGVLPYSPLARGMLAGGRDRGGRRDTVRAGNDPLADDTYTDEDFDIVDAVRAVASGRGVAPAQVALAWLIGRPGVTAPIVGATKLAHLRTRSPRPTLTSPAPRSRNWKRPTAPTAYWVISKRQWVRATAAVATEDDQLVNRSAADRGVATPARGWQRRRPASARRGRTGRRSSR